MHTRLLSYDAPVTCMIRSQPFIDMKRLFIIRNKSRSHRSSSNGNQFRLHPTACAAAWRDSAERLRQPGRYSHTRRMAFVRSMEIMNFPGWMAPVGWLCSLPVCHGTRGMSPLDHLYTSRHPQCTHQIGWHGRPVISQVIDPTSPRPSMTQGVSPASLSAPTSGRAKWARPTPWGR